MKCWRKFDSIVCIHFAPAADRLPELESEFKRVGLIGNDRFRWHYTVNTASDSAAFRSLQKSGFFIPGRESQFSCCQSHYHVVATELARGSKSILVLEDDIRFLRNTDRADEILSSWDEDKHDLCLFDRFVWKKSLQDKLLRNESNDGFIRFEEDVRGASCYAMNERGMNAFMQAESNLIRFNTKIIMNDAVFDLCACRKYVSTECACIQKEFPGCQNKEIFKCSNYSVYGKNGVDVLKYNID